MLFFKRSRAFTIHVVGTTVGAALVAGFVAVPAAHSANLLAISPAATATVTVADHDAFREERLTIATVHQQAVINEAAASQARAVASVAVRAARARAALVARAAAFRATAVKIGLSRKGMSYSAGSSGPRAFDCSGFTSYVWRTAGRSIGRSSYDQYATLRHISRAQARPGDLVFFFGSGAHHVGLYLGRNKMIHSANYGSGVVITSLSNNWYASRLSGFRAVA